MEPNFKKFGIGDVVCTNNQIAKEIIAYSINKRSNNPHFYLCKWEKDGLVYTELINEKYLILLRRK